MSNNKPTCKTYPSGTKEWFLNGELHREDGPAVECASGDKEWWLNDKLHREDGPAVEYSSGAKEWFLNNERTTALEVFKQANDEQRKHMLCFYPNEFSA
jgi:hypothetical protein